MILRCTNCGEAWQVRSEREPCPNCGGVFETVNRRRGAPLTVPMSPEQVEAEINARVAALAAADATRPVPERVVFSWPGHDADVDEDTAVLPVGPFPGVAS